MKIVNSNIPLRWVKPEIKRNKKIMNKNSFCANDN